jgi:ABC-type antimicrobial peptide transport system permease subunit
MLHNYLKTAWRSLMQHKPLTALNVAGLTMGMTAAVLIFLWVQNELSFDRFEPGADRIYSVSTRLTAPSWAWEGAPMLMAAAVAAVAAIWKRNFPSTPLQYQFLDEAFERMYRQDAIAGRLVLIFTMIALGISALGLFGLAAFAAERREREIGIRRVLGATTASIGALLSREFIQLVVIAILLATPLAMAVLITGWQAVKAAWKNPVQALRRE